MKCKEVIEQLSEFWSGELDEVTKKEIEAHLQSCALCREEWVAMSAAMFALKNATTPEPPAELLSRIKVSVRAKQVPKFAKVRQWRWAFTFGVATIAFLFIFASISIFRKRSSEPIMAEMVEPILSQPAIRQPQTSPPSIAPAPAMKVLPSPVKRMVTKPPSSLIPHRKPKIARESSEVGGPVFPELVKELPSLEIPYGERLSEQKPKDIPTDIDIAPRLEHADPQIAELPSEPRRVPFKAELELKEAVKVPMPETEMATTPKSPPSPSAMAPMMARQKEDDKSQGFGAFGGITQTPTVMQHGGGLQQAVVAMPFQLRWVRFEPILVGRVRLWELGLTSESQQIVRFWIQPGEKVEILNAQRQFPTEAKGLVLWHDKLTAAKEAIIPILIRANELGTRKVLLTVETADGKTFSWWCIFPVMLREGAIKFRHSIAFQIEQWTILDLFSHIAWESKFAFLLPEQVAQRVVNLPMKTISVPEVFALLERQIGGRFTRFGSTISWIGSIPPIAAPMMKQQ